MTSPGRALWDAPAASPPPPPRVWRDWVLVGALVPLIALEAVARPEVASRWLWAVLLVVLVPTLLWRRTHPLAMLAIAFTCGTVVGLIIGGQPQLFATAYFLILVYALMRWGSGRAMVFGCALLLAGIALTFVSDNPTIADTIGGLAVLVAVSTVGITFRWRASARSRELESMRLLEREQLARDLHDTVAHHVSAIAIQAQAGQAIASTDPAGAAEVLQVIEGEASRTLDEMRSMVRLLRHDDAPAELAPIARIADLRALARADAGIVIDVDITGDADSVAPTCASAVFRIAQEAITNARRHAADATRVDVRVQIDSRAIHLDVRNDGSPVSPAPRGFGTTGMIERAALLGGTCEAGPLPGGGWIVTAALPMFAENS